MAGTGTYMRKALEGHDDGEKYVADKENRAMQKETAQLGLDDAKFRTGRRQKLADREDTQYQRKEDQYNRETDGKKAISNAMVNNDFTGITSYLNKYTRDGATHYINKNDDGSFEGILDLDGNQVKKKFKDADELMQYTMMVSKNDPFAELNKKAAAKTKAGDRQHDMNMIDRKGLWDLRKSGKKGSGKMSETLRKVANDMEQRSKSRRGQMTAMGNIDMTGISSDLANYDGMIGVQLHDALGLDTNEAYTKAYNMVTQLHKTAEKDALAKFPDDDKKQAVHIRASMELGANKILDSIQKKAGSNGLSESSKGIANKDKAKKQPPYDQFLIDFKAKNKGATDADANRMYQKWFPDTNKKAKPDTKKPTKQKESKGLTERQKRKTPEVKDFTFGGAARRKDNVNKRENRKKKAINEFNNGTFSDLEPEEKRKWLMDNLDYLNHIDRKKARKEFAKIKSQLNKKQG